MNPFFLNHTKDSTKEDIKMFSWIQAIDVKSTLLKILYCHFLSATCILSLLVCPLYIQTVYANDSAAAIAAGGIQLTRQENISVEKEELFISKDKITVAYEFRNVTDKDITTEIAFPIPEFGAFSTVGPNPSFRDFRVFINDKSIPYQTEVKAFVKEKEVTSILQEYGIMPETFGGFVADESNEGSSYVVNRLSSEKINHLIAAGAIKDNKPEHWPEWTVAIKYHWTQSFPAR
jgi:hypothetical protein